MLFDFILAHRKLPTQPKLQGPHTQNTLSSTYRSAVHLTEDKSTFVTEEVYSKTVLRRLSPKLNLKFTARNSNLKSSKFNLYNVNIGAWLNVATLFYNLFIKNHKILMHFLALKESTNLRKFHLFFSRTRMINNYA